MTVCPHEGFKGISDSIKATGILNNLDHFTHKYADIFTHIYNYS